MRSGKGIRGTAVGVILMAAAVTRGSSAGPGARPLVLEESAEVRLAQLEVSASGPRDVLLGLRPSDFVLKINGSRVTSFDMDWDCPALAEPVAESVPLEAAPTSLPRPASFLFYFDMPHLTMAGRQLALDRAKELVGLLIRDGNQAMILSNAATVATVSPFRSDPADLLAALDRLEDDRSQFDPYASFEQDRMSQVITRLNRDGLDGALGLARSFYVEDRWRGERNLQRLSMSLGLLADVDAPKAVLYFADTMRAAPGEFYLKIFNHQVLDSMRTPATDETVSPLQIVVRKAATHGIRFYPVQAEGLTAALPGAAVTSLRAGMASTTRFLPTMGVEDAQSSLTSLATETGGEVFLNGVGSARIAQDIRTDLACVLVVSFDPSGFPADQPMPVKLTTKVEGVDLHYRGTVVAQSESALRVSRLMAAFLSPESHGRSAAIRAGLVPTGYSGRSFTALVQVAVSRAGDAGATWDLAVSASSGERTAGEGSARLEVSSPRAPVVLEKELRFSAGPYELVSVAQDVETGRIASRRDEGRWPDPDSADAVIGPIAILQRAPGAFTRDGHASDYGLLAVAPADLARSDRATAVVSLICRRRGLRATLRVERKLVGENDAPFTPMEIEPGTDRCFQIRDLLAPGTMSPGEFRYQIRVLKGGAEIAHAERVFGCAGTAPAPSSEGAN